jgi:hypothetical protein
MSIHKLNYETNSTVWIFIPAANSSLIYKDPITIYVQLAWQHE